MSGVGCRLCIAEGRGRRGFRCTTDMTGSGYSLSLNQLMTTDKPEKTKTQYYQFYYHLFKTPTEHADQPTHQ